MSRFQPQCYLHRLSKLHFEMCVLFLVQEVPALPVTPLSFLRAMWEVSRVAAARYTLTHFIHTLVLIKDCLKSSVADPDP